MKQRRNQKPAGSPIAGDSLIRKVFLVAVAGIAGCAVARAPTMLDKISVPGIGVDLGINAGYVLVFGPLALFLASGWIALLAERSEPRDDWKSEELLAAAVLFLLVPFTAAFLSLQYFLLLAPSSAACYGGWRLLFKLTQRAFQPTYCMGLPADVQAKLPYIELPAVQAWAQILLTLASAWAMRLSWCRWRCRASAAR